MSVGTYNYYVYCTKNYKYISDERFVYVVRTKKRTFIFLDRGKLCTEEIGLYAP